MQTPDETSARFYFALPRLLARMRGASAERSEQNGLEAAFAGALVHTILFLFAAHLLLNNRAAWQVMLLIVPVALAVLAAWSVLIYLNALIIRAIRAVGLFRDRADRHLQSVLIGIATTFAALHLINAGIWMRVLGSLWIVAVTLNLTAALVLGFLHAETSR